ncbi:DUF1661 domain-containing protein [Porphyromonas gingivalis]|uniref:DUF1661 domain-containing protein n=1 Tax=Porphyromonas gingivalis TaxID=837 RepID=UPI0003AD2BDD|nr:DUF1661 domain-containing protein [Porphyromonas gingivalis]ERJ65356.1 hypothetical protein HMPREF1553_02147 [Porphyromonas gingivalis F0568]MCE8187470.1 DUF1661 domain-containing protein [Porphyromonas gingivalis]MCE8191527.1 DUF1661 domain-containing protein [Porphyromonas gingivalis]
MQKKAAVLDPSPISALFVKAKLCYCTRSFIRRITYFLYVLIRVFGVLQAFLWANETYFFCGCRIARFFSFAFLSLQGDIERCFRFEKIENRQTKKTWLRKFFVLARDFFHSRAKTEKKSRVFCRKTEPQFLLFRCVFCERFLLR